MIDMVKKIFQLLSPRDRKRLALLFIITVISSLAGVTGIASILPFVAVLSNPGSVHSNKTLSWIYTTLGFADLNTFIIYLGIFLLIAFLLSNIILAFSTWYHLTFTRTISYNLSRMLFEKYLRQPYEYFLNKNSSDISKNIFSEVSQVIAFIIRPCVEILTQGLMSCAIAAFLIFVSPAMALSAVAVFGGIYAIIFLMIRKRLSSVGKGRVKTNIERFKAVGEAFGGVKDVKLLGKEDVYISRFSKSAKKFETYQATTQILSRMPKYALEAIAFGGMLAIALYLFAVTERISDVLPLIALFAFAGYRLMPLLQELFRAITEIRSNTASLDILYRDLKDAQTSNSPLSAGNGKVIITLKHDSEIELDGISFNYGGTRRRVINSLNLRIPAHTTIGFVGPTGCGKTTLIDVILGLLRPQKGKLVVGGLQITNENLREWQNMLGYVPQQIYLTDDTITRNIAFGVPDEQIDIEAVQKAAKTANIHRFIVNELPLGYDTLVGERGIRLSGGQRQRIGIARALYHDPAVLVLDEATSALDGRTEMAIMEAVETLSRKKTIIMIAHRLTTLKYCDQIHVMDRGRIVESGRYNELNRKSKYFKLTEKERNATGRGAQVNQ